MAPKRGMSAEDKRKTLLAIFHEFKDVFVLKVPFLEMTIFRYAWPVRRWSQGVMRCFRFPHWAPRFSPQDIEKLGSKRGVVLQSIKDVLQVGDAMVEGMLYCALQADLVRVISNLVCSTSPSVEHRCIGGVAARGPADAGG